MANIGSSQATHKEVIKHNKRMRAGFGELAPPSAADVRGYNANPK